MAIDNLEKLRIYNNALRLCGETPLKSLSQEREARLYLDSAWVHAVDYCLEMGQWKFAIRTVSLTFSPSVTPEFGFTYVFDKPEDLLRVTGVYSDEGLITPLLDYRDEGSYWYGNIDPLFVSYVSSDTAYGYDSSIWTNKFKTFIAAYLASEIINNLRKDAPETLSRRIERELHKRLTEARSHDAQQGPTRFAPQGNWVSSRYAGVSRRDYGSRGRLIG